MTSSDHLRTRIDASLRAIAFVRDATDDIARIAAAVRERVRNGGTIYTAGNGGSAAEALHLSEELIGRYCRDRGPIASVCLNADPTAITCIANDFGFDQIFARPTKALVKDGDVLVLFSTSGNSANLLAALEACSGRDVLTLGLLGRDGGLCAQQCAESIIIPEEHSAPIQEAHQVVMHLLCEALDDLG